MMGARETADYIRGFSDEGTALFSDVGWGVPAEVISLADLKALVRERDELLAFGRQWEKEMMSEFDPAELENDPLWQKWRSAVEGK